MAPGCSSVLLSVTKPGRNSRVSNNMVSCALWLFRLFTCLDSVFQRSCVRAVMQPWSCCRVAATVVTPSPTSGGSMERPFSSRSASLIHGPRRETGQLGLSTPGSGLWPDPDICNAGWIQRLWLSLSSDQRYSKTQRIDSEHLTYSECEGDFDTSR